MGVCSDKSTKYLKKLGYNVVRHPRSGIRPLGLLGRQAGAVTYLGPLNLLITEGGDLPPIQTNVPAADVNGQASSKLDFAIGINILGSVIGAMGGNLGLNVGYTNARKIQFTFSDVSADLVLPLEIGNYLKEGVVDVDNLILRQYVMGNGQLYLITKTIKSNKITVKYERADGVEASVDVPAVKNLAGANVKVSTGSESSSTLTYEGKESLAFGFVCYEVGVDDGTITLEASKPGTVAAAVSSNTQDEEAAQLTESGLLTLESDF